MALVTKHMRPHLNLLSLSLNSFQNDCSKVAKEHFLIHMVDLKLDSVFPTLARTRNEQNKFSAPRDYLTLSIPNTVP